MVILVVERDDLVVARDAHGHAPRERVGHAAVPAQLPVRGAPPLLRRVEVEAVDAVVEVAREYRRALLVGAWVATTRGTYPNARGWYAHPVRTERGALGASRRVRPVRTQRGRLVRVARTYPTEAPGVITSGPHAGAGAYVSAQVVTCPVRKAKRGRMTRTYGGWLG